ncbi:endospore germination permease [Ectobacillus sp. JY-23]|uniref:endospore germination permease n=1 Tax=Ectobacillus sp. JY-23 TaxID=2933872 RepID=UPI001FF18117|nr:endospore germination permease [Ectobacillus sp. JY-23]UOY91848.1 endospore germination permease [Ectobacillus sp. JY-23]
MKNLVSILVPRQVLLLLILSTGLLNHVLLLPNLLLASGRDSWLSVMITYPIALLLVWCIYYIAKHNNPEGFYPAIRKRFGSMVYYAMGAPLILFLISSAYITFKDLMIWLKAYFLVDYSIFIITILLLVVCFIVTLAGIKYMAISAGVLLPLVVLAGIFISITNTPLKDPSLLFPVMSNGLLPILKGMMYTLSGLLEVYLVVLLQPYMQSRLKRKHLLILVTFLTILIFGPLSAAIMEFGPMQANHFRYPAYEQWRIMNIGQYVSHLDFLALYQWLCGAVIRIGLFMFLAGAFFTKQIKHYKLRPFSILLLYGLLLVLMLVKLETYTFYQWIYRYFLPACMFLFVGQIVLATLLTILMKKREDKHEGA